MRLCKRFLVTVMIMCSMTMLSGCVYANNKNWDDMSAEEKQEVRQEYEEIREELEEEFSGDNIGDEFASKILDTVGKAIKDAD